MATSAHIPVRGARRRIAAIISIAAGFGVFGIAFAAVNSPAAGPVQVPGSYRWPVKPFDKQHAVRGGFGDPRTIFRAPATLAGVLHGGGAFSLHRGIDISAPNGASVYPVMSGQVTKVDPEWIRVDSGGGRAFEYWHIHRTVNVGDQVEAHQTVIGHVMRPAAHVHLTELHHEVPVNPLAPGHLGPYRDQTTPEVTSIAFRRTETGRELLPSTLRGRVIVVAGAEDRPTIDAPGAWRGLPVSPAVITWEVRGLRGKVVMSRRVAVDMRLRLPGQNLWRVYSRGTYQNMAAFRSHYSYGQRGSYLFRLSPTRFDTRRLRNGAYDMVVTAADIHGNSSSRAQRFAVSN